MKTKFNKSKLKNIGKDINRLLKKLRGKTREEQIKMIHDIENALHRYDIEVSRAQDEINKIRRALSRESSPKVRKMIEETIDEYADHAAEARVMIADLRSNVNKVKRTLGI